MLSDIKLVFNKVNILQNLPSLGSLDCRLSDGFRRQWFSWRTQRSYTFHACQTPPFALWFPAFAIPGGPPDSSRPGFKLGGPTGDQRRK